MNKTYIIFGAVVIALVALFVVMQNRTSAPSVVVPDRNVGDGQKTGTMDTSGNAPMQMKHSVRELIGMANQNMKCTFAVNDPARGTVTNGTTYTSAGKVRTESVVNASGKIDTSYSIVDGDTMYVWGDSMPEGMKMSLSKIQAMSEQVPQGQTTPADDIDTKYDYTCNAWSADSSLFTPPANVTFNDMSAMMEQMEDMMNSMKPKIMLDTSASDAGMMDGEAAMPPKPVTR
jgi:hypothetical protein